jgi:hypothetical protein
MDIDIEGVGFFRIDDRGGSLLRVMLTFVATPTGGSAEAMYGFDSSRSKAASGKATKEWEKGIAGNFSAVGWGGGAFQLSNTHHVDGSFEDLVPRRGGDVEKVDIIRIGKPQKKYISKDNPVDPGDDFFNVTVEIDKGRDRKNNPLGMLKLKVPFYGNPGPLTDSVYHGNVAFFTSLRQEVAQSQLFILGKRQEADDRKERERKARK